jgi:hypothetical protein
LTDNENAAKTFKLNISFYLALATAMALMVSAANVEKASWV